MGGASYSGPYISSLTNSGNVSILVDALSDVSGLTTKYVYATGNIRGIADVVVYATAPGSRNSSLDASPTSTEVHVRASYFA